MSEIKFKYVKRQSQHFKCVHMARIPEGTSLDLESNNSPEIEITEEEFKNTKKTPITSLVFDGKTCTLYKMDE